VSPSEYVQDLAAELRAAKATILRQAETIASACVAAGVSRTADLPGAVLDLDRQGLDWAERASRAERERDEYQAQVHGLAERCSNMTSAASSAAGSTVIALERLQEYQEVVNAAVDWRAQPGLDWKYQNQGSAFGSENRKLCELVDAHIARVKARS